MSINNSFRSPSSRVAITLAAYAAVCWFFVDAAIATHKPCTTDFEGGCSYGKVWIGAISWLAACAAVALAIAVGFFAVGAPRFKKLLYAALSITFALPPLAYVLYGIFNVTPVALELLGWL